MGNINDSFFEGEYKEIWRSLIPAVLTEKEIDFMVSYFNLEKGDRVLDLMCGYGRHSLALGRKEIRVTAIDNLKAYIDEINETAGAEGLPVQAFRENIVTYQAQGLFKLAICMGNSLNFFNREDLQQIITHTAAALKPGGHFLINSWSIAEIVFRNFRESSDGGVGEVQMSARQEMHFNPTRVEIETVFTRPDGSQETRKGIDYIYSLNEMGFLLKQAGLDLAEVFSIPGKKKFTLGEPRAYLVARKP